MSNKIIRRLPPIMNTGGYGGLTWWGFTLLIFGTLVALSIGPLAAGVPG